MLALLDVPYPARFFGLEEQASLAHLHTGFLLAVAMVLRDPWALRAAVAANLAVWLGKMALPGALDLPGFTYGVLAMWATYGLLRLCARLCGWPRDSAHGGFALADLPRFGLYACLMLPMAFVALAATLELVLLGRALDDPVLPNALAQTLLAKLFGILILSLPLVVLASHQRSTSGDVRSRRVLPWKPLLLGVLLPVIALQASQDYSAWHRLLAALVEYRLVLAALLIVASLRLKLAESMSVLVLAQLLFALGLTEAASAGRGLPEVFGLMRIALELLILQALVLVVYLYHREREQHLARLAEESRHEPLSGLRNYNALAARASQAPCPRELGFLLLDRSEALRNSLGLAAEAALMRSLARTLSGPFEVYYIAPGQFALLATDDTADWSAALEQAHALPFRWNGQNYRLLPYLGVAQRGEREAVDDWLLRASNLAMDARERGEAQPVSAPARLKQLSGARRRSALALSGAVLSQLRAGALVLYAQPIVPLQERIAEPEQLRAEVLCRLKAVDGSLIAPDQFIPALAANGRMAELDLAVLHTLREWLCSLAPLDHQRLRLSINVDAQSLASRNFGQALEQWIGEQPLPASALCFEVTESAAIIHAGESAQLFERLRSLGCAIAIDDFGVGFQSFERLKQLPVDQIKIDGIFIREMCTSPRDAALVEAAVAVARAFGATTVAEYVGDAETVNRLRALGVDWAQGSHYGLARPIEDLIRRAEASSSASRPAV